MPIHLPARTSRRHFLGQLGAAFAVWSQSPAAEVDGDLVAILNDTHIGAQQKADSPVRQNLAATVEHLIRLPRRPAAVIINGDLALKDGQPGDYELFAEHIAPLRAAGIPVHLTMGNHDDRDVFYRVLANEKADAPPVDSRHIGVVQLARVNLILLDSLKATMTTQGLIGAEQLAWLAKILDAHAGKPAWIVVHHNPRLGGDPLHFPGGLEDSEPLWQVLAGRPQAKAYLHGHIHHRNFFSHQGIHILNTPATSYVGDKTVSTTGWTMARVNDAGAVFTTHTHLPDHPWNGLVQELAWR